MKGLVQWAHGLYWQAGEYIMNVLFVVFNMNMDYFETAIPISSVIFDIMLGVGWALLLGNLVFQAAKTMMTGLGFEGEDPKTLALRTFIFAFLLLASRQICGMGLSLGATVVDFLQMPDSVILPEMQEDMFGIGASWLIVVIVGVIIIFQLVKFFFEVGERYVIVGVLTILSPLAFAMGGSKNTADIFKGWARMYVSMCLMMVLNVVFMKLIVSAMAIFPSGMEVFPWLILMVALARVARKIDSVIARIGLNPAITGDGLGRGMPGMLLLMAGKQIAGTVIKSKVGAAGTAAKTGRTATGAAAAAGTAAGFAGRSQAGTSPINTNGGFAASSGAQATPTNPPVGRNSSAATQSSQTNSRKNPRYTGTQHTQTNPQASTKQSPGAQNTGHMPNSPINTGVKPSASVNPPMPHGTTAAEPLDTSLQNNSQNRQQSVHKNKQSSTAGGTQPIQTHADTQNGTQSNQSRQSQQSQSHPPAVGSVPVVAGAVAPMPVSSASVSASSHAASSPASHKPNDNIASQLQQVARSQSAAPQGKPVSKKSLRKPAVSPPSKAASRAVRDIAAGGTPVDTNPNGGDHS